MSVCECVCVCVCGVHACGCRCVCVCECVCTCMCVCREKLQKYLHIINHQILELLISKVLTGTHLTGALAVGHLYPLD